MIKIQYGWVVAIIIFLSACQPEPIALPLDNQFGALPDQVLSPLDNPINPEKVELGKLLFWDPILSGNKDIACVSCHHPNHAYAENIDLSKGVGAVGLSQERQGGLLVQRNAPTVLNTGFNGINAHSLYDPEQAPMFWDSRSQSLEAQAIQPIRSAEEMRGVNISESAILDTILNRLRQIPEYTMRFKDAFGETGITEKKIGKALAAFQRTLVTKESRFDQYSNGDETALSSLELRGMMNFIEVGCVNCHNGPMFSDFEMHVLTVPENSKLETPDSGNGAFAFRTPTLRNLSATAPYMHNGVFKSLEEVLDFYDNADEDSQNIQVPTTQKAEKLALLNLADDKVSSIIAFLNSLNDEAFEDELLEQVPSGLSAGGNIH